MFLKAAIPASSFRRVGEGLKIKLTDRLQGLEIATKFFEPDGDEIFADQTRFLS